MVTDDELIEKEKQLLGFMINNRELIPVIARELDKTYLVSSVNRKILESLKARYDTESSINPFDIQADAGCLCSEILEITEKPFHGEDKYWRAYCQQYFEGVSSRIIRGTSLSGLSDAGMNPTEIVDHLSDKIILKIDDESIETAQQAAWRTINEEEEMKELRVHFKMTQLDSILRLRRKQLAVISARPGIGKTTMALNLSNQFALNGFKVLFFTFEQPTMELTKKLVDMNSCKQTYPEQTSDFIAMPHSENISFIEHSGMSPGQIKQKILEYKPDIVFVDQLDCMPLPNNKDRYDIRVGENIVKLKQIAMSESILIVLLHQLSRSAVTHSEPELEHLKDSGYVEQKPDKILFLYKNEHGVHIAKVAKNRMGPAPEYVELHFDGKRSLINER